jgi:hypothetical protein
MNNVSFGFILLFALVIGVLLRQQFNRTKRLRVSLANENEARTVAQENNLAAAEERALIAKVTPNLCKLLCIMRVICWA